jgi:DNA-binding response OmpR family regulator
MNSENFLPDSPFPPAFGKTVLLVDEDMGMRRGVRDFLVKSGFQVLEARNSYDALFLCAQHGHNIHLLITEISLLPVGGVKLAENCLRLWPHLQVVCMSEPINLPGIQYWMDYLGARFLEKPFSPFELHETVHGALGTTEVAADMPIDDAFSVPLYDQPQGAGIAQPLGGSMDMPFELTPESQLAQTQDFPTFMMGSQSQTPFWLQEP